jgi:enoyl-CoA hydratase/carnithine racemase
MADLNDIATPDDYTDTTFTLEGGVAVITLHRPDKMNAFSGRMGAEVQHALARCDADDDVRAVVITGAGRAFCAGADFSGGAAVFGAPSDRSTFSSNPFRYAAWRVRKPVIAAINGAAVGLGMTLTLHCDLRIVARDAKLGIVQNRRGVMPDADSHWMLPRIVGHARAAEILLTGKVFTGADAERWGLANEALDAADVLPRALEIARDIAVNVAPVSVAVSKRLLWWDPAPDRARIEQLETDLHLHLMGRDDAREGVHAFLERRPPQWTMKVSTDYPDWLDTTGHRPTDGGAS